MTDQPPPTGSDPDDDAHELVTEQSATIRGEAAQPAPVAAGERWRDRYEPISVLGRGGQGHVLRAIDHQHNRTVALKVRPVGAHTDRAALLAEARVLLNLKPHSGVPLIRDDFFRDDDYVIVMEWIEGANLAQVLTERGDPGLPFGTVLAYLEPIADALDHLHTHEPPVVHGDVKLANLILTPGGAVVLVDFGISSYGEGGTSAGSPGYRAPEIAAGAPATPAADIYGFAATAHALLTGRPPAGRKPTWAGLDPVLIGPVERALRQGLATDPDRRPGSAHELLQRLRAARTAELPSGVVTFLLTDIDGSASLWDTRPHGMETAVERHDHLVAAAVEENRGSILRSKGEGDSTFSVFAKASDAVNAAVRIQRTLRDEPWPEDIRIQVRAAVHTGEAQLRGGSYFGGAPNRAARLRGLACGGQTLFSQTTAQLVADTLSEDLRLVELGPQQLRGLRRTETVYELRTEDRDAPSVRGRGPGDGEPPSTEERPDDNLPLSITSFVGRRRELERSHEFLAANRLLTLTGTGGCGKTRLAVEIASRHRSAHPDGARFVDLAPITDPGLTRAAVAAALEVPEARLLEDVRGRRQIVLLDNCEHLPVADLALELLEAAPGVRIVATSRQPLGTPGEAVWRIGPLATPQEDDEQLESIRTSDAVRLFVERARLRIPDFELTEDNASAVAAICRRLDGLPLAIELTAGRIGVLSPEEIAERLDEQLFTLARRRQGERRHQALDDLVDWSYDLLSPNERHLLRTTAVFRGGFPLRALEAVAGDEQPEDVLDGLTRLVDLSLVTVDASAPETRYSLLETVREYAWRQTAEEGEQEDLRQRHASYVLDLVAEAKPALEGSDAAPWVDRLSAELDNLRAALTWAAEQSEPTVLASLAGNLFRFWQIRGLFGEGRRWLEAAIARTGPGAQRRQMLVHAGHLAQSQGELSAARVWYEEAVESGRAAGDLQVVASALQTLGTLARGLGDPDASRRYLEESLEASREIEWVQGIANALYGLGILEHLAGNYGPARASYEESLAADRDLGNRMGEAGTLDALGSLSWYEGRYEEAAELLREGLAVRRAIGNRRGVAISLVNLAGLHVDRHDLEAARPMIDELLEIARQVGAPDLEASGRLKLAGVRYLAGDLTGGVVSCEQALDLYRTLGKRDQLSEGLHILGIIDYDRGEHERAIRLLEESVDHAKAADEAQYLATALATLGRLRILDGRAESALKPLDEAASICASIGEGVGEAGVRLAMAVALALDGDPDPRPPADQALDRILHSDRAPEQADAYEWHALLLWAIGDPAAASSAVEAVRRYGELRSPLGAGRALELSAWLAARRSQWRRAGRLLGVAESLREAHGVVLPPLRRNAHEEAVASIRAAVGEDELEATWAEGRTMSVARASELAVAALTGSSEG